MSMLHYFKMSMRRMGFDIHRYNARESQEVRLVAMFKSHDICQVLDVGANDGGYGRSLRRAGYSGRILSFEPLESAHASLLANTKSDKLWEVAAPMALGNVSGIGQINVAGNSASSSILPMEQCHTDAAPESAYHTTQPIHIYRLDELTQTQSLDRFFLKIDTQGYEQQVLEGASGILEKVQGLQIELSIQSLYRGQWLYWEAMNWIKSNGFELCGIIPGFSNAITGQMLQFDGIFFRE